MKTLPHDNLILDAARFATQAHRGQVRYDGEAYINHPMRVAGMVTIIMPTNEVMVAAGWLHDVVEDCDVSLAQVNNLFGADVGDRIRLMEKEL
jgi:GTP pyrophosphokinase